MEHQTDIISESRTYEKFPYDYDPTLNGLGGWMILVTIGLFLTFFTYGSAIADLTLFLGYSAEADVYMYIMIAVCVLFGIVLTGLILLFIFKRNILFRKLLVIQIAISLATTFVISFAYCLMPGLSLQENYSLALLAVLYGLLIYIDQCASKTHLFMHTIIMKMMIYSEEN